MGARIEIQSHPTGPWLLRVGRARFVLPRAIGKALAPLDGSQPDLAEIAKHLEKVASPEVTGPWSDLLGRHLAGEVIRSSGRAIRLRVPLIPASVVDRLAGRLRPLAGHAGLAVLAAAGCAGYRAMMAGTGPIGFAPRIDNVIAGLGLLLMSALWHELGHAAAVARSGYPPGGIGAGLLFVIPVLYADVTAVGVLPRSERVRVDLAGIAFQLAAGGLMAAVSRVSGLPPLPAGALTVAAFSALAAVVWSLIPFLRSDGYWLLCDLLDLESLEKAPPRAASNPVKTFLVFYQLTNAVFLCAVAVVFPWRVIAWVLALGDHAGLTLGPATTNRLAWGLFVAYLAMTGRGLAHRIRALLGAAFLGGKGLAGHLFR